MPETPSHGRMANWDGGTCELCARLTVDKSVLLDPEPPGEEIDEPSSLDIDDVKPLTGVSNDTNSELPGTENIFGTESLRAAIHELCGKYSSIFSSKVKTTPALVQPLEIQIEGKDWSIPASRRAPRPQSREKLSALKEMIENLLRLKVIRHSEATHASQVLLVAKKGTAKLRFCIDYRELNDISSTDAWPLPNIGQLLNRIGDKKAKFFGVMDLTSGYHQAPLAEASKKYTAFVTALGMFEWNRVPMGLKAAGSYFQRTMVTQVLRGLIFDICECYLDDIITYGEDEKTFLANLEAVFARLQQFNVTLNPAKCRFGMSEIEYVGHVINDKGVTFTRDKLDSVVNFPKPETEKDMKSFLGLANYFRLHVQNHTDIVAPLEATVTPYVKNKRIVWTAEMDTAFIDIKRLIDECPLLYFFNPDAPVFLQTDASMRGIGAYLFQVVDGKEVPIEFLSKAFAKEQTRWSTFEQEAYAIFYALRKWDHLLRDAKFTLQTDHRNLVFINSNGSAKVKRWKLLIQEYDFNIEHIAGVKNVVADTFSRLCPLPKPQSDLTPSDVTTSDEFIHGMQELNLEDEFATLYEEADDMYDGIQQCWALDEEEIPASETTPGRYVSLTQAVYDQIKLAHNAEVGHGGVKRTLDKLKRLHADFPNKEKSVQKFIKDCPYCQKTSQRKVATTTLPFTIASTEAMQVLSIDTIGPLPEDNEGYKYILAIIDNFSRWISLYALRSVEAKEAAEALIHFFGIFGVPQQIMSDGGTQFMAEADEVIKIIGAQHSLTIAHSHQQAGIVERSNKETLRHLRAFMFDQKIEKEWRAYLPFTQRILNAEVVEHLGVAPAQIIFGAAIDLDRGILTPNTPAKEHDSEHRQLSEYVRKLIETQRAAIKYAATRQEQTDARHVAERTAALSGEVTSFKNGSYVLVSYPDDGFLKTPRPPNKLLTKLKGPLQVISSDGPAYTLRDHTSSTKDLTVHVARLRPFYYDKERIDPVKISMKDTDQFLVEEIRDHRGYTGKGHHKKVSQLELLVKWVGFETPEWQPWHNFTSNSIAHAYLRTNNLQRAIPRSFL